MHFSYNLCLNSNKLCSGLTYADIFHYSVSVMESRNPRATRELKSDRSTVILTADKGVAMVVMDRQYYVNKAEELLGDQDTCRPISKDPTPKLKN